MKKLIQFATSPKTNVALAGAAGILAVPAFGRRDWFCGALMVLIAADNLVSAIRGRLS
jgi:hypothetical protein